MAKQMYTLRDIPKYDCIRAQAVKYPEIDPVSTAACLMLLRVASDVLAALDDYLAEHDMSRGRWSVLMLLMRTPELPQNPCELASKAGVTRATMTGLLDGLERDEFVARETVAADRRMLEVRLTDKGRKYVEQVMPQYFMLIRKVMGGLSEAEKEMLISLLTKLGATAGICQPYQDDESGCHELEKRGSPEHPIAASQEDCTE
jgi:DNA-binding MarR family transcriptional regulator